MKKNFFDYQQELIDDMKKIKPDPDGRLLWNGIAYTLKEMIHEIEELTDVGVSHIRLHIETELWMQQMEEDEKQKEKEVIKEEPKKKKWWKRK